MLKALLRFLVLFVILLIGFFYFDQPVKENEPLKGPTKTVPNTTAPQLSGDVQQRPKTGWSTYVGKDISTFEKKMGQPIRKGPSAYGFTWWVYGDENQYMLVGVEKDKINQVYVTGTRVDFAPFKMGQTLDELYRTTITDMEVNIKIQQNIYTMVLSEEDLQSRLLIMYNDVLAQLYFDSATKKLMAVRYIDGETLVKQKPYDMTYVGEVIETKKPSSFEQEKINQENAQQLFELSNVYREINDLPALEKDGKLSEVTSTQLKGLVMERLAKSDAPDTDLQSLLKENDVDFEETAENIAEDYADAADAISGILNSEKHRQDLLNVTYNHLGTASFENNFAQIFIEQKPESDSK